MLEANIPVTPENAIAFVELHGIVLESARGPVPNLADAIAGQEIQGSWWGHPKGHEIFAATRAVRGSPDVLVCRLVQAKVTYVHRRLWPAIIRLAGRFSLGRLAAIYEQHTESGKHEVSEKLFPEWVPEKVNSLASHLSEKQALQKLGDLISILDENYSHSSDSHRPL